MSSGLYDEDGIDGPFDRGFRREMKEDAMRRAGMSKRAARKLAQSNSYDRRGLRAVLEAAKGTGKQSRVNPGFTKDQAIEILIGGLRAEGEGRTSPGSRRDILLVTNILREAGEPGEPPIPSPERTP